MNELHFFFGRGVMIVEFDNKKTCQKKIGKY
jgi:hypothetical protein